MGIFNRKSSEEYFWIWFQKNENMIFNFEYDQEAIFNDLALQIHKIHNSLTFEFGPIDETGCREFVISADGIKEAFPAVEKLYSIAPNLKKWKITKFRPRRIFINDISYGGKTIKASEVFYKLYEDEPGKVGIILFFPNYKESERNVFAGIGFLMLDEAIGEYDVETKLGSIDFKGRDPEDFNNENNISKLASEIDKYLLN